MWEAAHPGSYKHSVATSLIESTASSSITVKQHELWVVERHQINHFMLRASSLITQQQQQQQQQPTPNANENTLCAEWDDTHLIDGAFSSLCPNHDKNNIIIYSGVSNKRGVYKLVDPEFVDPPSYAGKLEVHVDITENNSDLIPSSIYSVIIANQVLEHIFDLQAALVELTWVLAPNGYLIISVPFFAPNHAAPNDFWRFTPQTIRRAVSEWGNGELALIETCVFDSGVALTAGAMLGLDGAFFTKEEMLADFRCVPPEYDTFSEYTLNIHAIIKRI
ncbi:hypothetical protein TL16_g04616 [Triparma laevis f. inornata]|uniref:Methyltransferase type 11 domain-containing protein n=2 Tax=Triparma laevis TaxID=1534972 RepID=A0A9W7FG55_9STRA|nr:hypothetical protein TL16_g04616 [Triparma laevis f. inornata]GMI11474.1 hypothetical protein TrLO_g5188 [Triparma laevis f. longispina]